MVTETLADAMRVFFADNTGLDIKHSLTDMQFNYYSSRSGLTPIWNYSLANHQRAFFESIVGEQTPSYSNSEVETAYYRYEGAVGTTYDDVKYDFYTNRSGGIVFITDNFNGTGYANTDLAPFTDNNDGTGFIGLPGVVTDNHDGTGYGFIEV